MPEPNPLQRYLVVQRVVDREMAAVLRDAANEGERLIEKLATSKGIGARVERAQAQLMVRGLRKQQGELWGSISKTLQQGMARAGAQAAEAENLINRVVFNAIGGPIPELERAMQVRAQAAVQAYVARTDNDIPLSSQVYRSQKLSEGLVAREVNRGILLGQSARQIADRVRTSIRPDVPGGVSYAAKRLGRTELNNAFHRAQIDQRKDSPFTEGFKWHLSGSHPRPDACNDYADDVHYKGGDRGVYRPSEVPGKPHPNCLCYLTTVQVGEDEFVARFLKGEYNTYIDSNVYRYAGHVSPC